MTDFNRVISYWVRLIENLESNNTTKLAGKVYVLINHLHNQRLVKSKWINNVKDILCNNGFSGIWYSQSFINGNWLRKSVKQKIKDIFIQKWLSDLDRTSNSNLYKHLKQSFKENCYIKNLNSHLCRKMIAFLTRNHNLPVEVGRWRNIPVNERLCTLCRDIGDEYHFLMICPIFRNDRKKFLKKTTYTRPNMMKFVDLLKSENIYQLRNLAIFCDKIMKYFRNQIW